MTYFWCTSGEDGTSIEPLTENQLRKRLKEVASGDYGKVLFLKTIPDADNGCWMGVPDNSVVVIRGDIIVPQAKQRITEYEIA